MGLTKTELFTDRQNQIAKAAKALAHPARVAIIECLLEANTCINGDLVLELGLAQPTVSQHLRELKDAGVIRGDIEGTAVRYCIDPIGWKQIEESFNVLFNHYKNNRDKACC